MAAGAQASCATATWPVTRSTASSRCSEHSPAGRIGRVTPSIRRCFVCEHPRLLRRRCETYSTEQTERIFAAASPRLADHGGQVLLGTAMRLSELCGPIVDDFEDDGVSAFLKVRRGKGGSSSGSQSATGSDERWCTI